MAYRSHEDPAYAPARRLQGEIGLIDLHVDALLTRRLLHRDITRKGRAGFTGQPFFGHADIPRMREGGYSGALMGVHYLPLQTERGFREAVLQVRLLDRIADADRRCLRVRRFEDWDEAKRQGLLALAPSVEGAHVLNGRIERVSVLANLKVACLTLVHLGKNAAGTPGLGRGASERDGLTDFGRALVGELNRKGIVVDVAHLNMPGALMACRLSDAPVFATHAGAKAVHDHPRNLSDEALKAVAATGGTVGIIFAPNYLAGKLRASTSVILDHMDHVVRTVGAEHVSLGSDYDGWLPSIPSDQRDCRDAVKITHGLLERGYSEGDIRGFLRENALRVLRSAGAAATSGA